MIIEDIGAVLGDAAAFDNRTIGKADTLAWFRAIGHLNVTEARSAVIAHYSETRDRLMPFDVLRIVRTERGRRLAAANIVYEPIGGETVRQFMARIAGLVRAAADGQLGPRPIALALEAAGPAPEVPAEIEAVLEARRAARTPLNTRCPFCQALPGNPCRVGRNHRAGWYHPARQDAARETQAAA